MPEKIATFLLFVAKVVGRSVGETLRSVEET